MEIKPAFGLSLVFSNPGSHPWGNEITSLHDGRQPRLYFARVRRSRGRNRMGPGSEYALRDKLDAAVRTRRDWKTFAKALQSGTEDLAKNKEKIEAEDPNYQWIDLAQARADGIMPISYAAP